MDAQLAQHFFQMAAESLGWLREYSFAEPTFAVDDRIGFAYATFLGENLAIECIWDERESDVACKICRVVAGTKTPHYAVDENGIRAREALSRLLRRKGITNRLFSQVGHLDQHSRIKVTLADYAEMLKLHGQEILADSPDALA